MDKEKKERLMWFFDFVNLDIDGLAQGDRMKWGTDTLNVINFGSHQIGAGEVLPSQRWGVALEEQMATWERDDLLKKYHHKITGFFRGIIDKITSEKNDTEWKQIVDFNNFFSFAEFGASIKFRLETPFIKTDDRKVDDGEMLHRLTPGSLESVPLLFNLRAEKDEDTLLLRLMSALEGVTLGSLRQCPECNKYFLHTTKRIKAFCSNKCAARKANRDARARIRESDPERYEAELEDGAARARASYCKRAYGDRKISIQHREGKYQ